MSKHIHIQVAPNAVATFSKNPSKKAIEAVTKLASHVQELLDNPSRMPCKYCKKYHLDYACDAQIEFIKKQISKK